MNQVSVSQVMRGCSTLVDRAQMEVILTVKSSTLNNKLMTWYLGRGLDRALVMIFLDSPKGSS